MMGNLTAMIDQIAATGDMSDLDEVIDKADELDYATGTLPSGLLTIQKATLHKPSTGGAIPLPNSMTRTRITDETASYSFQGQR